MADQVMRMPAPQVQRKCACGGEAGPDGECAACKARRLGVQRQVLEEDDELQMQAAAPAPTTPTAAPPAVQQVLSAPGRPLDAGTRAYMEPRFGHDFSQVRVHTDAPAAESARAINARAYTVGRDVVFGAGQYAPGTGEGQRLLAHELVHTLQQERTGLRLQRTGAGNCARVTETVDEQRDELARAGRIAHSQVQGFFSAMLDSEVAIPRATKNQRDVTNPPSGTPAGKADLWHFGGGLGNAQVGEIKSYHGRDYAQPDADHYRGRLGQMADRIQGGSADSADTDFNANWLDGRITSGHRPGFNRLTSFIATDPVELGPFRGDPLKKNLKCTRYQDGAIVYWCTLRRLSEEEEQRERLRLGIPENEDVRRTAPQTGRRRPTVVDLHPDFHELWRRMPALPEAPRGRVYTIVLSEPLFREIHGAAHMQRQLRLLQIPYHRHPIHQFRVVVWSTLAATLAVGVMAGIAALVVVTAPVSVPAIAAGGGTAAAGGRGAVVIPLFTAATTQEVAKAAAVLIVVGSLTASANEAHAQQAVERGMSNDQIIGTLDVTDDPHALSGGWRPGSHVTVNDKPYRVIAVTSTR